MRQVVDVVAVEVSLISLLVGKIVDGVGGLEAMPSTSDARVVLEVPSNKLDVVTATVVVAVVVVAVQFRVFCTGRGLCRDRVPGAVGKSLLCCANGGRRLCPALVVVPVVVVDVAAFLVIVIIVFVVVIAVVAVTALSVLVSVNAVVVATRTVDCLAERCLPKCSITDLSGQCPLPMEEHTAQPHSILAAGWKCFKCFMKLLCRLYLPLLCIWTVDSPA